MGDDGCTYTNLYSDTLRLGSSQIDFKYNDPYESARVMIVSTQKAPAPEEHGGAAAAKQLWHPC